MANEPINDHAEQAIARLPGFQQDKPNWQGFLNALVSEVQALEDAFQQLLNERHLSVAVGVQLDGIGEIIGLTRNGLNDSDYRIALQGQAGVLAGSGEGDQLIEAYKRIMEASNVTISEHQPATAELNAFLGAGGDTLTDEEITAALSAMAKVRAAGVQLILQLSEDPPFLFGDVADADANGDIPISINGLSSVSYAISSSFASPGTNPTGLTFDDANLISCDSSANKIYIHTGITSTISSSFASPATNPSGLAYDGVNLISCDNTANKIYIHTGITSTISSSFASPSTAPNGLTFDGVNLISCDSSANKIYIHTGITSTITSSFASPSTSPTGLTFDGTDLISCDIDGDKIYIHTGITSTISSSFASISTLPRGLAFGNSSLINCDTFTDKFYIYVMLDGGNLSRVLIT